MTSSFLSSFVSEYATNVGFTSAEVFPFTTTNGYEIVLHDDVVDEHVSFTVAHRDLLDANRAVMRRLAYEIDRARREVERRVMGDEVCP